LINIAKLILRCRALAAQNIFPKLTEIEYPYLAKIQVHSARDTGEVDNLKRQPQTFDVSKNGLTREKSSYGPISKANQTAPWRSNIANAGTNHFTLCCAVKTTERTPPKRRKIAQHSHADHIR
jgi:hypothetical protein